MLEQTAVVTLATPELHPDRQSRVRETSRNGDDRVGGDGDARAHAHPPEVVGHHDAGDLSRVLEIDLERHHLRRGRDQDIEPLEQLGNGGEHR